MAKSATDPIDKVLFSPEIRPVVEVAIAEQAGFLFDDGFELDGELEEQLLAAGLNPVQVVIARHRLHARTLIEAAGRLQIMLNGGLEAKIEAAVGREVERVAEGGSSGNELLRELQGLGLPPEAQLHVLHAAKAQEGEAGNHFGRLIDGLGEVVYPS